GYGGRREALDDAELARCLGWLASFHAAHLGRAPRGLWPTGTYWHLGTRQDELAAMQDRALRDAAPRLDAALRGCAHRTWVHGDAKVANFCFAADDVAAVDFQYVGGGCGVQDVAYFLSSCLDDAACERRADELLDVYFEALRARLPSGADVAGVEREWRALYPAAWADFHRFLDGWAPDHWKIHDYTRRMTREALARL
ncbi:MAG: phosphotransferase, partial [Planctomycetota bacterium]